MYTLIFSEIAKIDLQFFKTHNPQFYKKALKLIEELTEHPFTGTGNPERLKYDLSGKWSRRISSEHRIVYSVHDELVEVHVLAMRYHYTK